MKKLMLLALSACLMAGLTSISSAEEDKKKGDKGARRAELIKKYDKNGDGKLDEAERAAAKEDRKRKGKDEPKKEKK